MSDAITSKVALPIRLAPGRRAAAIGALFMVFWLGTLIFVSSRMVPQALQDIAHFADDPVNLMFLLVPAIMFFTGIPMFVYFASRFLPSSPLDHLAIAQDGIARRLFWKRKQAAWSQIGRFGCIERTRKTKNGTEKYWLIMAEGTDKTGLDDDQREKQALLSFDSASFIPMFASKAELAAQLTQWLNELLSQVRNGVLKGPIAVPAEFVAAVRSATEKSLKSAVNSDQRSGGTLKKAAPKSVVER